MLALAVHDLSMVAGGGGRNWEYKDPQGVVQGPFGSALMQRWAESSAIPLDLQAGS